MQARNVVVLLVLAGSLAALHGEDPFQFGKPSCPGPILDKKYFTVCYNEPRRLPAWVAYAITRADVSTGAAERENMDFVADRALPRGSRAENSDYSGKGYDKGHMAPAADFARTREAMKATFVLSNAVPQRGGVNRGLWKELEASVRALPLSRGSAWVVSGPVFIGDKPVKTIGKHKVAVPTHTFKVILCVRKDGSKEMFAAVLPNINKPAGGLANYTVSVNEVEKLTGFDFFNALPAAEETRLERTAVTAPRP